MKMYDNIVLPVDGSDRSKRAARRGIEFARTFGATVDVLHIVPQKALQLSQTAEEKTQLRERGEDILAEIEEIASEFDYPITTQLLEGKPGVRICEFAAQQNAGLIVMGRQGTTGLKKRLLGGVTEHVLHRSTIPVFVVPKTERTAASEFHYSRLLLPTDGSENAEAAIPHGAAIAQQYGAAIHVLNVVDLQAAGGVFNAGGLEKEFIERLEARGRENVQRIGDKIHETAPDVEIESAVERTDSHEDIAAGLRAYVQNNDIDLIVMGSHGASNLERQLLGSITTTLLRTVDVPVLVVEREG